MADHYYAYQDAGAEQAVDETVTIGSSSAANLIELRIRDGAGLTKLRVYNALEAIKLKITKGDELA